MYNKTSISNRTAIKIIAMATAFCLMVAVFPISFANALTGSMTTSASNSIATDSEIQEVDDSFYNLNDGTEESVTGMIKAPTVPSPGAKTSIKISYAKIKKAAGATTKLAALASVIVGIISLNYEIPSMLTTVLKYIKGISKFTSLVTKGSPDHGIKVNLAYTTKTIDGKKRAVWKVTSITTY